MAYPLAERKATGAHSEIDNLIGMNDLKQWWNSVKGKNILGQEVSPLTGDDMLDIAMSISPVGASIRGGKVAKQAFNPTIKKMMNKLFRGEKGKKLLDEGFSKEDLEYFRKVDERRALEKIKERNMLSKARIQLKQTQDKNGLTDPDKQGMVDPVSALLNYFSKN